MRMRASLPVAFLAPLLAVLAACSSGADPAPQPLDLTGFYMFNEDESDDLQRMLSMPGRPAGFGAGGMAGGTETGIDIAQTDSTVTIDYIGGPTFRLYTDGRELRREMPNGGSATTKCHWRDGKLRVERRVIAGTVGRGGGGTTKTVTTYWLEDGGSKLYVRTTIEGALQPMQFTRVYDASARNR